ncbi:MAG: hypothetical protein Q7J84_05800 [Sulfuricaulis sp.]|nr:hypothetical protein [Sulfuricaulis sp.]
MNDLLSLSVAQLKRAITIKEQIESLESELAGILRSSPVRTVATIVAAAPGKRKKVMSPEARAKIAAAQKARWKKFKAAKTQPVAPRTVQKAKRTISAESRKRMAEGAKARWAKIKAAKGK